MLRRVQRLVVATRPCLAVLAAPPPSASWGLYDACCAKALVQRDVALRGLPMDLKLIIPAEPSAAPPARIHIQHRVVAGVEVQGDLWSWIALYQRVVLCQQLRWRQLARQARRVTPPA